MNDDGVRRHFGKSDLSNHAALFTTEKALGKNPFWVGRRLIIEGSTFAGPHARAQTEDESLSV
jgi:hypothetical protein